MWITSIPYEEAEGDLRSHYDRQARALGEPTELTMLGSLHPPLVAARLDMYAATERCPSRLTPHQRNLISFVTSALNRTDHCMSQVTIKLRDPVTTNHHGDNPEVGRVDLIAGDVTGLTADPALDRNPTTRVVQRFRQGDWSREGEYWLMTAALEGVSRSQYLRVRGTNTKELEPETDPPGEDPWTDLWFYSNPIFIEIP